MMNKQNTYLSTQSRGTGSSERTIQEDSTGAGRIDLPVDLPPTEEEINKGQHSWKRASAPTQKSGLPDYWGHAEHIVQCLCDAYGFVEASCGPFEIAAGVVVRDRHSSGRVIARLAEKFAKIDCIHPIEKVLKWFYSQGFSFVTGEALAPITIGDVVLNDYRSAVQTIFGCGRLGRFLKELIKRGRYRFHSSSSRKRSEGLSIAQTFTQMKKGTPVISPRFMEEAKAKHRKALEDPLSGLHARQQGCEEDSERVREDDRLLTEISKVVREVFRGKKFKLPRESELLPFPSFSAHFHTTRKQGGAASFISDAWFNTCVDQGEMNEYCIPCPDGSVCIIQYSDDNEDQFRSWLVESLRREAEEGFLATPIQIQEPLKVRTVTAGPEVSYWVCILLQKFMWRQLKSHKTFELIGRVITPEVMDDLLSRGGHNLSFLSGDYSAATDNLRVFLSRHAIQEVCRESDVPAWLSALAESCLCDHHLSEVRSGMLRSYVPSEAWSQGNGQLMGSPISFPILCVINAAVCRMSFGEGLRKRKLSRLPLKINGDDCAMRYTDQEKRNWEYHSASAGLAPSPGKCFFSKRFVQMNSVTFSLTKTELGFESFSRVPYWNFGLVKGRSSKGDKERSFASLGALAREFVSNTQKEGQFGVKSCARFQDALSVFIRRQAPLLRQAGNQSWWLPKAYGGLGLPQKESKIGGKITTDQHVVASYLHSKIAQGESVSVFGNDTEIHPWLKQALREVRKFEVVTVEEIPDDSVRMSWAEMGEDDCFWEQDQRIALYTPILWAYSNKIFFDGRTSKDMPPESTRFSGRTQAVGKAFAGFEDSSRAVSRFNKVRKQALRDEHPLVQLHELLQPRRLKRTVPEVYLSLLKDLVPAPRGKLFSSLHAPGHFETHLPSYTSLSALEELSFLSRFDVSDATNTSLPAIPIGCVCAPQEGIQSLLT